MTRVLVTGGSGFIGRRVVALLVARGDDVIVIDRLDPAPPVEGARYVRADVRELSTWERAIEGVDAVCHQAARVGLGVDLDDIVDYADDNDLGTATGLLALHRIGFDGRLVLASSMVVYGEGAYTCEGCGPTRPGPRRVEDLGAGRWEPPCPRCDRPLTPGLVDETAPMDPRNVYAATKLHQEHLAACWARESGGSVFALRYHNVYGPGLPRDTPYAGVAAIFASAVAAGRPVRVFEDGGQRRDFIHVDDVARANLAAIDAPATAAGAYNVASGRVVTIAEVARSMVASAGAEHTSPVEVVGGYRLGDVRHVTASPLKARRDLGFEAQIMIETGLGDVLDASRPEPGAGPRA